VWGAWGLTWARKGLRPEHPGHPKEKETGRVRKSALIQQEKKGRERGGVFTFSGRRKRWDDPKVLLTAIKAKRERKKTSRFRKGGGIVQMEQ